MQIRPHGANRAVLLGVLVISAFVLAVALQSVLPGKNSTIVAAALTNVKDERVLIAIGGMHCTSCASGIKAMLKRTSGVTSVEVSFERREADVEYDPDRTSPEKLVDVIAKMGYKATVKERRKT